MATQEDKPNTQVIAAMFGIGAAAMLGGSAAIVALARTEIQASSEELGSYADLSTVRDLKAEQRRQLAQARLPIDVARQQVLRDVHDNPRLASPATPDAPAAGLTAATSAATTAPLPPPEVAATLPGLPRGGQ